MKLIYLHIPKTAGTSFERVIRNNGYSVQSFPGIRAGLFAKEESSAVIGGHMVYGIHWLRRCSSFKYITFLRDPVERCISHYYYVQEWVKDPLCKYARSMNIVDFYRLDAAANMQVRYLGGNIFKDRFFSACSRQTLDSACARSSKMLVGFVENYELSVSHICKTLAWTPKPIVSLRGAKRPSLNQFEDSTIKKLRSLNRLDCELYEYCREQASWLGSK